MVRDADRFHLFRWSLIGEIENRIHQKNKLDTMTDVFRGKHYHHSPILQSKRSWLKAHILAVPHMLTTMGFFLECLVQGGGDSPGNGLQLFLN